MRWCVHDWRCFEFDQAVCRKCRRSGRQWYDLMSGGVDLVRGVPLLDLRRVYDH